MMAASQISVRAATCLVIHIKSNPWLPPHCVRGETPFLLIGQSRSERQAKWTEVVTRQRLPFSPRCVSVKGKRRRECPENSARGQGQLARSQCFVEPRFWDQPQGVSSRCSTQAREISAGPVPAGSQLAVRGSPDPARRLTEGLAVRGSPLAVRGSPDPARRLTEGLQGQRLALFRGDLRSAPRRGRETRAEREFDRRSPRAAACANSGRPPVSPTAGSGDPRRAGGQPHGGVGRAAPSGRPAPSARHPEGA